MKIVRSGSSLIKTFSVLSALFLVFLLIIINGFVIHFQKVGIIKSAVSLTVSTIRYNIGHYLKPEDFTFPKTEEEEFVKLKETLYSYILNMPGIIGVKIYNHEGMVVWSDERELIGGVFFDDKDLIKALNGEVAYHLIKKPERYGAVGIGNRILKIFIPVQLSDSMVAEVDGVIEISKDMSFAFEKFRKTVLELWMTLLLGFSALYITLYIIVKSASDTIEKQNKALVMAEKWAAIGTMAASIGHELNNAVTPIMAYSQMLEISGDVSEATKEAARVIRSQSQKISQHASNLLNLGKPREPKLEEVSINELLDESTNILISSGILKHFEIIKDYKNNLPKIKVDKDLIQQVINNIEINAAHAMGKEGRLTITTDLSKDGKYIEFTISDTGSGIPEDIMDKIFEPFFTTKSDGKGTGLGLYIVKNVVEQHNGYVKVISKVGKGTDVIVGLPI